MVKVKVFVHAVNADANADACAIGKRKVATSNFVG